MGIKIEAYRDSHVPAVAALNARLQAGGVTISFPEDPVPAWLPKLAGSTAYQEYFVAVDDKAVVRGAYALKHQQFRIRDQVVSLGQFRLPVSEGVVNRAYSHVGVQLLRDALKRQPLLFSLGIGGRGEALARLLVAAGWSICTIPFFYRVIHPVAFLRNVSFLRRRAAVRWAFDGLAATGLGWLAIRGIQAFRGQSNRLDPSIAAETVEDFSSWADEIWQKCRDDYGMSAVRDAEALQLLRPKDDKRLIRLKVSEGSRVVGWAVVLDSHLSGHKYFGDMRLGSIVSGLATPADAAMVVRAAAAFLRSRGVDLIVSNQSHTVWCRAFSRAGFLRGPSNFLFASSPQLTALLGRQHVQNCDLHLTRGDGDGPINL